MLSITANTCVGCPHDLYWHRHRREDKPDEFFPGICMVCGCEYQCITTWGSEIDPPSPQHKEN